MKVYRAVSFRSAIGELRTETFEGREHLVVPVVGLVEGVIQAMNAPAPELVLAERFSIAPSGWNGRPLFLNHPMEGSSPISGNTPEVLARSFGRVFNTSVDMKRLLMEAWIDEAKATELGGEEAELVKRVRASKKIEISTGAFIVLQDKTGYWGKTKYQGVWDIIVPDHLALLSDGATGACSYTMGCGVRAASDGRMEVSYQADAPKAKAGETMTVEERAASRAEFKKARPGMFQRLAQFLGAQAPEEMGDVDLRDELRYALSTVVSQFRYNGDITVVYPQNNRVVYQMYEPEGIGYYSRTYSLDANGEATVNDDEMECERVTTYEPIEPGDELTVAMNKVVALAGARHSGKDQKMVQTLHDTSVSLGADCAGMTASSEGLRTSCGCNGRKTAATALPPATW